MSSHILVANWVAVSLLVACAAEPASKPIDPDPSIEGSGPYDPTRATAACTALRLAQCNQVETCANQTAGKPAVDIDKCFADITKQQGTCAAQVAADVCTAKSSATIETCTANANKMTCAQVCVKSGALTKCAVPACTMLCLKTYRGAGG